MQKKCKSSQNIELQDILICDKCKKNNSLIKEDVPIMDNISSQNKKEKENLSNIYEYNQIQQENLKNKNYNHCIKCLIFLLAFLIINWIIIYIYFSYFQKINTNKNTNELQKEKDIIKRKLKTTRLEIFIKANESQKYTYILNKSFYLKPNQTLMIKENEETTICGNYKKLNYIDIENTSYIIKLIFELENANESINFENMFYGCNNIKEIDISGINCKPKINSTSQMFKNCNSLTSVKFTDISFSDVESMEEMFSNCYSLKTMDLSYFNLTNVKSTKGMFKYCNSLTSVNFSKTYLNHLETTESMFENCKNLNTIEFFKGNLEQLKNMENTFQGCTSLTSLSLF